MTEDISSMLSSVYNQGGNQASNEDLEKQAQLEFFNSLCQEQGIDINQLDDSQVDRLWKTAMQHLPSGTEAQYETTQKEAAAQEMQIKQAASQEILEKRSAAEKIAEADMLGRLMAHSYVDELRKLAEDGGGMPPALKAKMEEKKDQSDDKDKDKDGKDDDAGNDHDADDKEASAHRAEALIAKLSQANGGSSTTGHLDVLAANHAVELLKQAGVDAQMAFDRINAVHTLGVPDSMKVASVNTLEQGVQVRALEYCEAAGFPVNWSQ